MCHQNRPDTVMSWFTIFVKPSTQWTSSILNHSSLSIFHDFPQNQKKFIKWPLVFISFSLFKMKRIHVVLSKTNFFTISIQTQIETVSQYRMWQIGQSKFDYVHDVIKLKNHKDLHPWINSGEFLYIHIFNTIKPEPMIGVQ